MNAALQNLLATRLNRWQFFAGRSSAASEHSRTSPKREAFDRDPSGSQWQWCRRTGL